MTVYRIEHHETKEGPFANGDLDYHDKAWKMPAPCSDKLIQRGNPDYRIDGAHACRSMDDVTYWFGPNATQLALAGYKLRVYDVPDDAADVYKHQVIYDYEQTKLLLEIDLTSIRS